MVASPETSTISPDACRVQLSSEHVGRVGLSGEPSDVIPVNYVYDEDAVIIRVDSSSVVARSVGRTVRFEVDQNDGDTRVGWSVLAAGVLDDVTTEVAVRWGTERQVRLYPRPQATRTCGCGSAHQARRAQRALWRRNRRRQQSVLID